ncbi:MAG: sigma-70 family RNA polymerase sigma factor [Aequorivita sp.]
MDKKNAFITTINQNQGLIFKVASIYTNNDEDKKDLSQEIIYQLWKSFDTFQQRSSLSTWMYRVAMNVAIQNLKTSKRKVLTISMDEQFLNFQEGINSEIEEKWKLLKKHIDTLNLLDKGIVILYLENKSHKEIAQIIGISTSNVGTKLNRIKEKLKKQILKNY